MNLLHAQDLVLPDRLLRGERGCLVKLHYRGERAEEPVLAETLRRFPVLINILHGRIEYIGGAPLGTLVVGIQGDEADRDRAVDYLRGSVARLEFLHVP